jgi:branched-chain amino acid aminotransferase
MSHPIWYNGHFSSSTEVTIPFLTHGLHYGSAVFEGIRVYDGVILQLREHCERLLVSAELMDMRSPFSLEVLMQGCQAVVAAQQLQVGYIRPLIWRGTHQFRICSPDSNIEAAIAAWHVPTTLTTLDSFLNKPATRLTMAKWRRPSPDSSPFAAKASGLYVIPTLAAHEARAKGFDDALMLDYRGHIAEATSSNVFLVIDGALHTPTPDCFLNGLTRQTVIRLAQSLGIAVHEGHLAPEMLAHAVEIFLTGTTCELLPVAQLDEKHYTDRAITHRIMKAFFEFVQTSITEIKHHDAA